MRRETVLVVDDDAGTRSQCLAILEAARLTAVAVSDGPQALAALSGDPRLRDRGALAILDYVLPGATGGDHGLQVFGRLKQARPDLAGILLTGHTSLNVAVEALNLGFSNVLAKPVDPVLLTEAVVAALHERQTRVQNARLRALTRLYDALGELAGLHDRTELYQCIVRLAVEETSADTASLMLLDEHRQELHVAAAVGLEDGVWRSASRRVGEPISGWVLHSGVALELTPARPVPSAVRSALHRPEVTAALCLPLAFAERPVGVLNISRLHSDRSFRPGDIEVASVLASDAALTIQRLALLSDRARSERIATVGRLASTIIHDLRGPVTIIRGANELLQDECPEQAAPLGRIEQHVADLDRMCEQLLSFARDASNVVYERFALADLLSEVARAGRDLGHAAGVGFHCTLESDGLVDAARGEITRALTGLLESAVAAAPSGAALNLVGRLT
ncbi:MAG: response regulator, partial [Armatimonadetes bacterium]|nr:response regulator [Armatimonadota bacterium]